MRVFKGTYKDRDGKQQEAERWTVEYRNRDGKPCRLAAWPDKRQSEEMGRKLDKIVGYQQNGEPIPADLSKWAMGLPERMVEVLVAQGIVEERKLVNNRGLLVHLEGEHAVDGKPVAVEHDDDGLPKPLPEGAKVTAPGFIHAVGSQGGRPDYVRDVCTRVRRAIAGCGFEQWRDVSAEVFSHWLAQQRATGKGHDGRKGIGTTTSNNYVRDFKRFCRFVAKRLGVASPMDDVRPMNATADRRHDRRAMELDEITRILDATWAEPEYCEVTGEERWLIYRVALETGLRPKQIKSLTRSSFDFKAEPATVTAEAWESKAKRAKKLPLRPDLAALLKDHLKNKTPGAPAFRMFLDNMRIKVFRRDMAAARKAWVEEATKDPEEMVRREGSDFLKYRDSKGRVADFYACRHTFVSQLAHGGVHPKVAQQLAQHSTIALTMNIYTHVMDDQEVKALGVLPTYSKPKMKENLAG